MVKGANFLEEKAQEENWKAFQTWLKANAKTLGPADNRGIIYGGQKIVGKVRPSGIIVGGAMKPNPMPMWKFIKGWNELYKQVHGKLRYETVEDVLKKMKPPRIKWTQGSSCGVIKVMTNMYDCANDLSSDKQQMLSKPNRKKVWPELSKVYVSNIKGQLEVMEGVLKDFRRLDESKIMIKDEIPVLLKNDDLDLDSKKEIKKLYDSYKQVYAKAMDVKKEIIVVHKKLKSEK